MRAIAAHCVWTTPEDWALLAEKGVSAVHNPVSNLKLGSGVAPVVDALEMATVNGGKALGRKTGRIEKGYDADLILLDAEAVNLIPCHDAANNLAYAAHGSNVVMNMARGKVIYKNGEFLTIDIERVKKEVEGYALPLLFG